MKYQIVGITDEQQVCGFCGKMNLKSTVVLKDTDGYFFFVGSTCAARALSASGKSISGAKVIEKATMARREEAKKAWDTNFRFHQNIELLNRFNIQRQNAKADNRTADYEKWNEKYLACKKSIALDILAIHPNVALLPQYQEVVA
jgi:hypothetical protein